MRAHSIESRNIQTKQHYQAANDVPEAYSSVCSFFPKQQKEHKPILRRCQSASALAKRPKSTPFNNTQRLTQLQFKYRNLEQDYRKVLEEVRSQTELFCKQKDEIQRLNKMTQKQQKQIVRLKQLIRMTEKKSFGLQTDSQDDHSCRKRIEASTGQSELTSETRCDRTSTRKQSQSKQKSIYRKTTAGLMPQKQKLTDSRMLRTNGINGTSGINGMSNNGKERAPLSKKYKFIPTLNFRHN